MYVNVEIYVEQRRINIAHFKVDLNNIRQRRKNVVIFNVDFHNAGQRWSNVVNMTIWKKIRIKPRFKTKITFLSFKEYAALIIFFISFSILRGICKRRFAGPQTF